MAYARLSEYVTVVTINMGPIFSVNEWHIINIGLLQKL